MTRSRYAPLETALGFALMLASGVVVVTCSASRGTDARSPLVEGALAPDAPGAPPASLSPASPASPDASAVQASAAAPASPGAPALDGGAPGAGGAVVPSGITPTGAIALPRFARALAELSSGKREDHVRIAWLGDSHTAADVWSGAVRRALQARYGNGGPGFVHVGWAAPRYRHEGVKIDTQLKWSITPSRYATSSRTDDGVFGLGGVRFAPTEPGCTASVEVLDAGEGASHLRWDLAYRLPDGASSLRISAGDTTSTAGADGPAGPGGLRHKSLTTAGRSGRLQVSIGAGKPELFGLVAEGDKPGVVLDTLGLNGARASTFLAWDEASWVAELARRKPDVVVLAFGTNESSDPSPVASRYERAADQLLARARAAAPSAECLVITPMDRGGHEFPARLAVITEGLASAARKAGCVTWSALDAMGGPGSMEAWAHESPPRSGQDGVHLTGKGYLFLADRLARDLMPAPSPAPRKPD